MNPWEKTENFEGKVKVYYDNLLSHFKKYKNKIFVESGTFLGNGLQCALDAGFEKCYSIEIHEHLFDKATIRFQTEIKNNRCKLFHGDSGQLLMQIIKDLDSKATFWLDAHISSNYGDKLGKNCPILDELDLIGFSNLKTHTILIDDLNCFGKSAHDYITIDQVKNAILNINSNYQFDLLDAATSKNILVAFIKEE
jgi:hypothetical protein